MSLVFVAVAFAAIGFCLGYACRHVCNTPAVPTHSTGPDSPPNLRPPRWPAQCDPAPLICGRNPPPPPPPASLCACGYLRCICVGGGPR